LVEIMVVIMIIGLLAGLVVPAVIDRGDTARETAAKADVSSIAGAVRLFYTDHGRLPELEELTTPDARDRIYIDNLRRDPWGSDYVVRAGERPRDFEVRCAGMDGTLDTDDDITSRSDPKR
jgi:general secretion pathway protein G